MNDILELKGQFTQKANSGRPGAPKLPVGSTISSEKMRKLLDELNGLLKYWNNNKIIQGALISILYIKVAAKSNRISRLFSNKGKILPNDTVVGAKFNNFNDKKKMKHIITHYIQLDNLNNSLMELNKAIDIMDNEFNGKVDNDTFNSPLTHEQIDFKKYGLAKSNFQKIVVDSYFVEKFYLDKDVSDVKGKSIISLYDTNTNVIDMLKSIGINISDNNIMNGTTVLLDENNLRILLQNAPYLVAMATEDLTKLDPSDFDVEMSNNDIPDIPVPDNEPTIGVIDTLFDTNSYFADWVQYDKKINRNISTTDSDYFHGTAVTSIIVDGPNLNPDLDDGCGRFKVRHFGVSLGKSFSSFSIIQSVKEIVASNPDINVWNFSLGDKKEIERDFISAEGAILDQIQFDYGVIFVISGTNLSDATTNIIRIGAPADSINSLVVNSVDRSGNPADYSRKGPVLSFFVKPDVSYYGGTEDEPLYAYYDSRVRPVSGTSFAAPWIARKLSYMIDVIGIDREVAKALIVDAAIGWNKKRDSANILLGHGIVPVRIENILNSPSDEIKFFISGKSEKYNTYAYNFPIPTYKDKYPFLTKVTMCYFPKCSRNQGVDYTNTELDIYFGRIKNNGDIDSVDKNRQSLDNELGYLTEKDARKMFKKWDNVKHISDVIKDTPVARKVYHSNDEMWGMSIKTKERLRAGDGEDIKFGVVVTLKEINGTNRIEDFIQKFSLKGWLVNRIDVDQRVNIYQTVNEDLDVDWNK
ncbi:S8 family peptidase [Companilactobacillus sp. HBUAS59699]|uniref:S8 family peptidase n=1 Tax=Companilactobacillus sp. HBUAS59699 TaxID=3109358 RepID=UPI002FF308D2